MAQATQSFASRPLGQLSVRDTARAGVGGAEVWVDYGRPLKRGREIFGNVVPWNAVWRTGANAATQFSTSADLVIGGAAVPAGKYTLWTLPTPSGWKLIINKQTGQWGTEYHPEQDLVRVETKVGVNLKALQEVPITLVVPHPKGRRVIQLKTLTQVEPERQIPRRVTGGEGDVLPVIQESGTEARVSQHRPVFLPSVKADFWAVGQFASARGFLVRPGNGERHHDQEPEHDETAERTAGHRRVAAWISAMRTRLRLKGMRSGKISICEMIIVALGPRRMFSHDPALRKRRSALAAERTLGHR